MKFLIIIFLTFCLFGSVSSQNVCQQTIETYTVLLLKMPMPSADNSKEQNQTIKETRKEIKSLWKQKIQMDCNFKDSKWYEKAFIFLPLIAVLLK